MKMPTLPAFSRRNRILAIAVVVGLGGALTARYALDRSLRDLRAEHQATVQVLVAKDELAAGSPVSPGTVSIRPVPAEWSQSNALHPEDFAGVENARLKTAVGKGEMLMWPMIEKPGERQISAVVDRGRRAITVPVDEISSLSGLLQPGDLIDLIVSADRHDQVVNFPLLQQARVLATGSQMRSAAPSADGMAERMFTTITLDATPEDARRVIAARDAGRLTAILRNPEDRQPIGDYRMSMRDLAGESPVATSRPTPRVTSGLRIIYGDKL